MADPKMVGRFAGCCASGLSGLAARDAWTEALAGFQPGLCPLRVMGGKPRTEHIFSLWRGRSGWAAEASEEEAGSIAAVGVPVLSVDRAAAGQSAGQRVAASL